MGMLCICSQERSVANNILHYATQSSDEKRIQEYGLPAEGYVNSDSPIFTEVRRHNFYREKPQHLGLLVAAFF